MKVLVSSPTSLQAGPVHLYPFRIEIRKEPRGSLSVIEHSGCNIFKTGQAAITTPIDFMYGPIVVTVTDES